ncbi:hypothetical protein ACIQUM_05455 [Amycolatopsis azurea]|uniref:hypothetical protein n=1 Tax=Amycolatopsis azurea TaxID=36819 RepID=UPI00380CE699
MATLGHTVTTSAALNQTERDERQLTTYPQCGCYRCGTGQHDGDQQRQPKGRRPRLQQAFETAEPGRVDEFVASALAGPALGCRFWRRHSRRILPRFWRRVTGLPVSRPQTGR